jgi:hypothetical protein
MMREYYTCGPDGNFIREKAHIPIQLQYPFPDLPNHDSMPTIGSEVRCDIGVVKEGRNFRFRTYIKPNRFKVDIVPNERVKIFVRAEADNALSNTLELEISWSGNWKDDTQQMAKNLVIREI